MAFLRNFSTHSLILLTISCALFTTTFSNAQEIDYRDFYLFQERLVELKNRTSLGPKTYVEQFSKGLTLNNAKLSQLDAGSMAKTAKEIAKIWEEMKRQLPETVDLFRRRHKEKTASNLLKSSNRQLDDSSEMECLTDMELILNSAMNGEFWALKMLDSWGGIGAGIIKSYPNTPLALPNFLGDFDECRDVDTSGKKFDTQYCSLGVAIESVGPVKFPTYVPFLSGVCAPTTCSGEDLINITNLFIYQLKNVSGGAFQVTCQKNDLPLTDKAKAVVTVSSVFAALMLFGTLYDIFVIRKFWKTLFGSWEDSVYKSTDGLGDSVKFSNNRGEVEPLLASSKDLQIPKTESKAWWEDFLLSFSVVTNGEKILSTKTGSSTITCINGIRFLSMTWVIVGHTFVMTLQAMENTATYINEAYKRWTFQAIINALVSVDTFFTLSGLLMAYLVLKELERKPLKAGFFGKFYFHRYWRLTPPYMLVLMTYVPLFKYISDGPMWSQQGVDYDECKDSWWTNLLYINNFVKVDKMCMGWSWYLANDMQFYIISPLIFIPLFYFGLPALVIPGVMLLANMITSGVISEANDLTPGINMVNSETQNDYFKAYYIKPYCRIGPYLIGILTGYLLFKTKCKLRMTKWQVTIGWMVATAIALAVLYGPFENYNGHPMSIGAAAFYNSASRIAWSISLSWLIVACACGYGGFVNTLLSWSAFVPLSRLTYCAYLVHPLIMYYHILSQRTMFYLNDGNIVYFFLAAIFLSYMVAFVASLAYEAPFLGLEKLLIAGVTKIVGKLMPRKYRDDYIFSKPNVTNGVHPEHKT